MLTQFCTSNFGYTNSERCILFRRNCTYQRLAIAVFNMLDTSEEVKGEKGWFNADFLKLVGGG